MIHDDAYAAGMAQSYDAEYQVIRDPSGDRAFYADLARASGGPVLELGCGTGRILLPIAREGIPCVGLDQSAGMLAVLREKHPPENLEIVQGSMVDFDLGDRRFPLIFIAFRGFLHLCTVEEQLACLACVRRHLAPGGVLAMDMFVPDLARTAQAEEPEQQDAKAMDGEVEVRRFASVSRDHVTQVMKVRYRHERWLGGTKLAEESTVLALRWMYPYELLHLLARAGFTVTAVHGGFDRRPFDAKKEMIVLAEARIHRGAHAYEHR
ncbi:MAG: class I SAM-dependent methyltransferase [Byssovorax sp.]